MIGRGIFTKRHRQVLGLAMAVVCVGCAREPDPFQRYVPAPELARQAVDAVLTDWQAGQPPGLIDRLAVKVRVSDNQRKIGQRLEEYEILGEVPATNFRCFAVRLRYSHPDADEKARYVVFGIDPLWVFRQEDYDMLSHWEHPMPPEENAEDDSEAGRVMSRDDNAERHEAVAETSADKVDPPDVPADDPVIEPPSPEMEGSPRE